MAFTLTETLVALVVLGIVAAITIPPAVRRQIEAIKRTKIKKAMAIYDPAIQKMVIENDIKSEQDMRNWADSDTKNDCNNTTAYFKTVKREKCEFKTADGIYWNIADILNPVIAFNEDDLHDYLNGNKDNKNAFGFVTSFDPSTGAFRTNDLAYEMSAENQENIEILTKLYKKINPDLAAKETAKARVYETQSYTLNGKTTVITYYEDDGKKIVTSYITSPEGSDVPTQEVTFQDNKKTVKTCSTGTRPGDNFCTEHTYVLSDEIKPTSFNKDDGSIDNSFYEPKVDHIEYAVSNGANCSLINGGLSCGNRRSGDEISKTEVWFDESGTATKKFSISYNDGSPEVVTTEYNNDTTSSRLYYQTMENYENKQESSLSEITNGYTTKITQYNYDDEGKQQISKIQENQAGTSKAATITTYKYDTEGNQQIYQIQKNYEGTTRKETMTTYTSKKITFSDIGKVDTSATVQHYTNTSPSTLEKTCYILKSTGEEKCP